MIAWILSLMIALQPQAPWRDSYEETARAIATVVEEEPAFFKGPDGRHRTAALLVSLAWAESRFDPKAVGDHGRSMGLYQIFHANLPTKEGFAKADILGNPLNATRVAHRMIRESMNVCASRPVEDRLAWYASGDGSCHFGAAASKFRYGTAMRVFRQHPPTAAMAQASAP